MNVKIKLPDGKILKAKSFGAALIWIRREYFGQYDDDDVARKELENLGCEVVEG